jgi:agmatinase
MANVLSRLDGVARLVQVGVRDLCETEFRRIQDSDGRIVTHFDPDIQDRKAEGEPWSQITGSMVKDLPENVYVSFDIDGLDPSSCPHTGTPVPGGLTFSEAVMLIRAVVTSGRRIVGFDLTEVAPDPVNEQNELDGNVGARMLYKLIGFTLLSQGIDTRLPQYQNTPSVKR